MSFQLSPDKIYMAPVGFGPALCSIQNQDGARYRADQLKEHVDQYTLSFAAGRDDLGAWLPEGLSLAAEQLIVRYERLTNVTWLAGRGFHRLELLLPVLRGGADGLFRLAAWESNADSILQGRDIFGRAVAYAGMEQERTGGGSRPQTGGFASWSWKSGRAARRAPDCSPAFWRAAGGSTTTATCRARGRSSSTATRTTWSARPSAIPRPTPRPARGPSAGTARPLRTRPPSIISSSPWPRWRWGRAPAGCTRSSTGSATATIRPFWIEGDAV